MCGPVSCTPRVVDGAITDVVNIVIYSSISEFCSLLTQNKKVSLHSKLLHGGKLEHEKLRSALTVQQRCRLYVM